MAWLSIGVVDNMNILAIDGSGVAAGVSVLTENAVLADYFVNYKKTHSQTLLPMSDEIMKMVEKEPKELDYIAVCAGPGSFTGLRICASTAKGLALALNVPVVPVKSIEALAYNFEGSEDIICPMMDARRGQVYTGLYRFEVSPAGGSSLKVYREQCAVAAEDIIKEAKALSEKEGARVTFLGDGVAVNRDNIVGIMGGDCFLAPSHLLLQRGASLGRCALAMIERGEVVSATEFVPDYLRLSQAEREKLERGEELPARETNDNF